MRTYKEIHLHGDYRNVTEERYNEAVNQPRPVDKLVADKATDSLQALIFAPDPQTGIPRSDLAAVMSKDTASEIRQYITDNLLRARSDSASVGSSSSDADFVLSSMRNRGESIEAYADRLRELSNPKSE